MAKAPQASKSVTPAELVLKRVSENVSESCFFLQMRFLTRCLLSDDEPHIHKTILNIGVGKTSQIL